MAVGVFLTFSLLTTPMDVALQGVVEENVLETPSDFSEFLEFTNRLNIPVNEEYFHQLKAYQLNSKGSLSQSLTVIEHGVKNCKYLSSDCQCERRLQNALWRAWWRQTRARFRATVKKIPEGENIVNEAIPEYRTIRVCGTDIGDFPTEYTITALKPHELPVVGTFVDKNVIPGFSYRVRWNGTNEYLFEGVALVLKSIGRGYGKRLTFESQDIENDNFFWSDSNPDEGFAFSIHLIFKGDRFHVVDRKGRVVGEALLTSVGIEQEIEKVSVKKSGIDVVVSVEMECTLKFSSEDHIPEKLRDETVDVVTSGIALASKSKKRWKAKTSEVRNVHVLDLGECSFHSIS